MSEIHFKDIDNTNESLVKEIRVKSGQEDFIETVEECLEEAETYHQWHPVSIYDDDILIGFAMYGSFGPNRDTWIDRIIIDVKYQGLGYGKKAMKKLIEVVSKEYDVDVLYLSFVEENKVAYNLYKSLGFEYMNEKDPNGELIFKYIVSSKI